VDESHYKIMKFTAALEPFEDGKGRNSMYTCSVEGCDCPAGHKDTCRHRKMLPFFIEHKHIDDGWFFIWNTHQWLKATGIFAEAAQEALDVPELVETMEAVGIPTVVVDEETFKDPLEGTDEWINHEGAPKAASAIPSSQPSPLVADFQTKEYIGKMKPFRRMK